MPSRSITLKCVGLVVVPMSVLIDALAVVGALFVGIAAARWAIAIPALAMALGVRGFAEVGEFIYQHGDTDLEPEEYKEQHPKLSWVTIRAVEAEWALKIGLEGYLDAIEPVFQVTEKPLDWFDKVVGRP